MSEGNSIFSRLAGRGNVSPTTPKKKTSSLSTMENASIEHSTSRKASDESFQKYPTSARQNSEQNILSAGRTSSQQQLKDHRTDSSTFSTNSAPVGIGAGKVAALRNRFESYSNGASPATPPPILVAVEDSRKASPGAKSSKHGKDKKKKKSKEASVSISVNSNGTREPEPDKDEFIDSKKKVRRSSIRRPSATGSNAGGGLSEDDLKSLTLDGDEGALPLTRKSSTLSTRQQAALRKTPSFLSRAHTPPPDQLREMKRRQKAESTLSESARSSHRDSLHSSTTNLDSTASTMTPSLNMGTPAAVRASGSASFKKKEKEARKSPTPSNGARSDNSPPPTTAAPIPPPPVKVPPKPSKPAKVVVAKAPAAVVTDANAPASLKGLQNSIERPPSAPVTVVKPKLLPGFPSRKNSSEKSSPLMHQSPKTAAPTPAEPNTPDTKAKEEEKPAGALSPEPEVVYTNRRESEGELVLKAPPRKAEASSPKTLTTDSKKRLSLSGNTDPISAGGLQTFDEVDTSSPIVKAKPKPVSSPLAKNGKPPLPNASKKTTETKDTADGSPVAPAPRHAQAGRRTVSSYVEEDDDLFEVAPTSSREDPADLDDDDDEEDEGLLEGFRPEGFDARRGRRTRSSIVFYINEMDSFSSSDEMVGDSALFRRDYMSLSALDRSAAGTAQPVPKITLDDYKAPRNDEYTLRPPSFKARTGHPYGTSSVAASAKSVLSSLAYDPYGLNSSTTSGIWGGGGGGNGKEQKMVLPKPPKSVYCGTSKKNAPDPAKIHRPIANTFGGVFNYDDEEDEEEWYWEEVEEEDEEYEDEEDSLRAPRPAARVA